MSTVHVQAASNKARKLVRAKGRTTGGRKHLRSQQQTIAMLKSYVFEYKEVQPVYLDVIVYILKSDQPQKAARAATIKNTIRCINK